ncbi:GNAT family N-acetyltransferase [Cohnella thermotolerans]|uniref:GNAT family N-acetyltransferase n=1 Tax=Cohnella thermotolerans TaxID=329858 RepID=UPI0003FE3CAF|nr:GNAT family N-acetyltransferase [Cohnella thermotolerans]
MSEHRFLWESVGWGTVDSDMASHSLAHSLYAMVAVSGGAAVGMGRIVGDDSMYFYIQDVAVLPEHQRSGIGKLIAERLPDYIRWQQHPNGIALAGLFASAEPAERSGSS